MPLYKTDVTREADVIEEVMRIYGYNNVEISERISFGVSYGNLNNTDKINSVTSELLVNNGFYEIMSNPLTKEAYFPNQENLVKVLNPLSSDLNTMRASMLYSGLEAISYNINRKNNDLKFFEFGKTYSKNNEADFKYQEQKHLSLYLTGNKFGESAHTKTEKLNFNFANSFAKSLLTRLGIKKYTTSEIIDNKQLQGIAYMQGKNCLAQAAQVSKAVCKQFDINQDVYFIDFNWDLILKNAFKSEVQYAEVSKFPSVRRDLALLVDTATKYSDLVDLAYTSERKLLKEVNLFDIYEGDKIEAGKKSYALSYILQDEQATLTDKQVESVMDKLIKAYEEKLNAKLRN